MTLQEFIEKIKTGEAFSAKVNAAILEKVILPMAQEAGVELGDEEFLAISGGAYKHFNPVYNVDLSNYKFLLD